MKNNLQNSLVKQGERVDDLQNGFFVIQDPEKFCFGMDAVLLSGFAKIKKGEQVLDMGTGTGIIPILLKAKTPGQHFTGLEIQEECAKMASRSVRYNGLDSDIDIVCGDIKEAAEIFGAASFHAVTCNPPYMIGQHGLQNPYMAKAIARHEILCTLEDVVSQAARVLKDRGRFYMVHRPFRLAEIFQALTKYKLEPKRMQLVYPFVDREPNMVLIEALKGGNSRITVEKPLIVYEKPGVYTQDILKIYGPAGA
jgi:tRNA1Val (adenine37-N6)-methyltransferase